MRASFSLLLVLAGCASPGAVDKKREQDAYERGYRQAVREQYWIIQNAQRPPPKPQPKDQP